MNGTPHTCFKMALVFSDILEYSLGILLLFHFLKGSHHFKQENMCVHTSFLSGGGLGPGDTVLKRDSAVGKLLARAGDKLASQQLDYQVQ